MSCRQVISYILLHLITSPEGGEGEKYSEGPTQSATSLNGRETAEGWHTSCHRCHGSASRCLVRYNLTSLGVRQAFSAMACWNGGAMTRQTKSATWCRQMHKQTDRHSYIHPHTYSSIILKLNYGPLLNRFPVIPGPLCSLMIYFSLHINGQT